MTNTAPVPQARDFMNQHVKTIDAGTSLKDAVNFLIVNEISNAPVVERPDDGAPRLVGFLSEQDCLENLSNELFFGCIEQPRTVRMIMKSHPICVSPETELFTLASIFVNHGYRHLPVVEKDRLLGIVSRRDILRAIDAYYREWELKQEMDHQPPDLSEFARLRFMMSED